MKEIITQRMELKTKVPKRTYEKGYLLKRSCKSVSNYQVIDNLISRFDKLKRGYSLMFEGDFLKIITQFSEFKVRVY